MATYDFIPINPILHPAVLVLMSLWSIAWKGLALWRAAQNKHKIWYVALLVINTVGLFEIAYLLFVDKDFKKICREHFVKMREKMREKMTKAPAAKPEEKPVQPPPAPESKA